MKPQFIAIATVLALIPLAQSASAESVPEWVKNNAGWWADGTISESEFVSAIQHLIKEDIIVVPPTTVSAQQSEGIPDWVKNTASWWSQGSISDGEFVSGIQHLITIGIITIDSSATQSSDMQAAEEVPVVSSGDDSKLSLLQADLEACSEIKKAYDRLNCESDAEDAITAYDYQTNGKSVQAGPMTFYYKDMELEITSSGQALLHVSMLAMNSGSDTVTMFCSGPSVCNYDVSNGDKVYKYSSTDFTNGAITLDAGQFREFNMLFGPNIGYGGTTFEYHEGKDYVFRVSEPWGSADIPLTLG